MADSLEDLDGEVFDRLHNYVDWEDEDDPPPADITVSRKIQASPLDWPFGEQGSDFDGPTVFIESDVSSVVPVAAHYQVTATFVITDIIRASDHAAPAIESRRRGAAIIKNLLKSNLGYESLLWGQLGAAEEPTLSLLFSSMHIPLFARQVTGSVSFIFDQEL